MKNAAGAGRPIGEWALVISLMFFLRGAVAFGQKGKAVEPATANTAYVPTMTFDVASIRETKGVDSYTLSGDFTVHNSSLRLQNFSMTNLLIYAYRIHDYQIEGLPRWPFPSVFTVVAKSDHAVDVRLAKLSDDDALLEKENMLRALLAERFKLKTHWETRQGATYNLVVAKSGRLHLSKGGPPSAEKTKEQGDRPGTTLYQRNDDSGFDYVARGASMPEIVDMLSFQLGHPITDKTGLTGHYDFVLKYNGATRRDRRLEDEDPTLPMDEAIQEELGLKVVPVKGTIQVLVVDHVEKPSEN